MKTIGLIGGMSWESSIEYYRLINQSVAEKLGGLHSARVLLYSLDFADIERIQCEDRWDDAASVLTQAGIALKQGGADFILICTNTMHKVADVVEQKVGLPVVSIIDVTGSAIVKQGLKTVGLLGTRFVMEEPFYRDRLCKGFNIDVIIPHAEGRGLIHHIIYDELCRGKISEDSRRACIEIMKQMKSDGAEGVILGCTELPLLIHPRDIDVPVFDTSRLHAEAAVNLAMT